MKDSMAFLRCSKIHSITCDESLSDKRENINQSKGKIKSQYNIPNQMNIPKINFGQPAHDGVGGYQLRIYNIRINSV